VGPAEISQICQIIRLGVAQGWKARELLQEQGGSQEIYTTEESILCQPEMV